MSEELKPCPFCGEGRVCLFDVQGEEGPAFTIGCVTDDCPGHVAVSWRYPTREKAIEAWNTRYERTCNAEQIPYMPGCYEGDWCSVCHCIEFESDNQNYCPSCGAKVVE